VVKYPVSSGSLVRDLLGSVCFEILDEKVGRKMAPMTDDERKQKIDQMLEDWDSVHRSILFFVRIGNILGWIGSVGAGIAIFLHFFHHHD
jgi:hypothetical protein